MPTGKISGLPLDNDAQCHKQKKKKNTANIRSPLMPHLHRCSRMSPRAPWPIAARHERERRMYKYLNITGSISPLT
uniref:Uncharacterized protein n=1 Tax=Setaria italica TaxID=4555 RepID=K3ZBF0_SETIT